MSDKDPLTLLEEADGEPRWLAQALTQIWHRLPPPAPPPPAPPALPDWDASILARVEVHPELTSARRWQIAEFLKELADGFIRGTHMGNTFLLGPHTPPSGARARRGDSA